MKIDRQPAKNFWRSLEEFAASKELEESRHREFARARRSGRTLTVGTF